MDFQHYLATIAMACGGERRVKREDFLLFGVVTDLRAPVEMAPAALQSWSSRITQVSAAINRRVTVRPFVLGHSAWQAAWGEA